MSGPRPQLPPDWDALAPLLDAVLDAPPDERRTRIRELTGGNEPRRAALEALVAECERGMPLLDRPAAERFDELADDPAPALPPVLADRYRMGAELGRGGMARVYLARDVRHQRDVAIKVIRPGLASTLGHDRFLREIEIAARLRHPNIVPVYDSGEAAGTLYFVMPREEGPSVRQRLEAQDRVPLTEAVSILRDVARALIYAHEHGVVHRDIKPDNVMLSGGAAVVTDFGIARALTVAMGEQPELGSSHPGAVIGTPAYMAPEQLAAEPSADHRVDIYGFGCLAFELLTGSPPFTGRSTAELLSAHLSIAPPSVTSRRPDVPAELDALISACLRKNPAERPQRVREFLDLLDSPRPARPAQSALRTRSAALLAGAALLAAMLYWASHSAPSSAPITLAVIPFATTGSDSAMDFVASALADEVAGTLARVPGIQIRSRSGARAYGGQRGIDVTAAGSRLRADYVMTGVIQPEGGRWTLSASVARARDAGSTWDGRFEVDRATPAAAAESVAASLVTSLRSRFPGSIGVAPPPGSHDRTSNAEAYRLYLRGREALSRRRISVKESADLFRAATRLDTAFAPAYAGLAMSLVLQPYFHRVPAAGVYDEVLASARRAVLLDSTLALPHVALGLAYQHAVQWDRAATEFEQAVRLEPRNVEARIQYARHLLFRGRVADAMPHLRAARDEDPASAVVLSWMSYGYYLGGQLDSARLESRRALDNDPGNLTSLNMGALVRLADHKPDDARRLMMRASPPFDPVGPASTITSVYMYVLGRTGGPAIALPRIRAIEDSLPGVWLTNTTRAFGYLGLGDTARTLTLLERATDAGETWPSLYSVTNDPIFAPLRSSPRFRELLRRVGLAGASAQGR